MTKTKLQNLVTFPLAFLFLFLVFGCLSKNPNPAQVDPTAHPEWVDQSWLTGQPCAAPCWQGLVPGKSSENEALKSLRSLSFIDPSKIQEHPSSYWDPNEQENIQAKLITAQCISPAYQICSSLLIAGGNLKSIILFPNQLISVRNIVDHLGEPDFIQILPSFTISCNFRLGWKEKQILANVNEQAQSPVCDDIRNGKRIDATLRINSIEYLIQDDIQLTSIPEPGRDFTWPGFNIH
jgi:hypothetical protein